MCVDGGEVEAASDELEAALTQFDHALRLLSLSSPLADQPLNHRWRCDDSQDEWMY